MAGTGMKKSKYMVDVGKRNILSNMIALTAPLAPCIYKEIEQSNKSLSKVHHLEYKTQPSQFY